MIYAGTIRIPTVDVHPLRAASTRIRILAASALALALAAQAPIAHAGRGAVPLPGLTDEQLAAYHEGFFLFRDRIRIDEGLGPAFNERSCYDCHSNPVGGTNRRQLSIVTRFARIDAGVFDPLTERGGTVRQSRTITPACRELVPAEANIVIERTTTSTFGAGLIEAIPDQQIIDRAAAQLAENPAMAGRVHFVTSASDGQVHVGRFGWKAQEALILDFSGGALVNEMGMTNALFPEETAPNGDLDLLAECDSVPDPEDMNDRLNKITNFMRFLDLPPPPRTNRKVARGEELFHETGCAFCHSTGYTAESPIPAIDGRSVPIYSDLLLHDIGTGDGIVQGDAQGNEFRTPPLFVDTKAPFLHDGRARRIEDAIDAHRVQAQSSRDAFFALSRREQVFIKKFLNFR